MATVPFVFTISNVELAANLPPSQTPLCFAPMFEREGKGDTTRQLRWGTVAPSVSQVSWGFRRSGVGGSGTSPNSASISWSTFNDVSYLVQLKEDQTKNNPGAYLRQKQYKAKNSHPLNMWLRIRENAIQFGKTPYAVLIGQKLDLAEIVNDGSLVRDVTIPFSVEEYNKAVSSVSSSSSAKKTPAPCDENDLDFTFHLVLKLRISARIDEVIRNIGHVTYPYAIVLDRFHLDGGIGETAAFGYQRNGSNSGISLRCKFVLQDDDTCLTIPLGETGRQTTEDNFVCVVPREFSVETVGELVTFTREHHHSAAGGGSDGSAAGPMSPTGVVESFIQSTSSHPLEPPAWMSRKLIKALFEPDIAAGQLLCRNSRRAQITFSLKIPSAGGGFATVNCDDRCILSIPEDLLNFENISRDGVEKQAMFFGSMVLSYRARRFLITKSFERDSDVFSENAFGRVRSLNSFNLAGASPNCIKQATSAWGEGSGSGVLYSPTR